MPTRNLISYNTLVSASSKSPRHADLSFKLFHDLVWSGFIPNASTFTSLAHAATALGDPVVGAGVHCKVLRYGSCDSVCVQTSLLAMYSHCGNVEAAGRVFGEMEERDCVTWNCMILGNVKSGGFEDGMQLLNRMMREGLFPNLCTFSIVLSACGRVQDWVRGKIMHAHVVKSGVQVDNPLENALIDMYCSCGDLMAAVSVFERMEKPDLVSWNSLMAGFSDAGEGEGAMDAFVRLKALSQFGDMKPDEYTFAAVVSATAALPYLYYGRPLHAQVSKAGFEDSIFVGHTLISMYFMNGDLCAACNIFECIPEKDVVIWTEMIVGHSRLGEGELAINYFKSMLMEGHKVDSFSLSSALNSSADLAVLRQGEMLQSLVVKAGYEENMCVGGSLVDMYAKNGDLDGACSVFLRIQNPDLKCWNSMIGGYGNHGNTEQAFRLCSQMKKQGMEPDHVTYVSLLSACAHRGLVERGRFYWFCMTSDGVVPGLKHYTCMVSLLSRAGLLEEAKEMIVRSPFGSNTPELWRIMLSSCVNYRVLDMAGYAAEQVLSLEPDDSATHILLSNLYASVGRWDDAAEVRKKIRMLMLEKDPGLSWIDIKSVVHVFSADDESHVQIDDCRNELFRLQGNLKKLETSELTVIF